MSRFIANRQNLQQIARRCNILNSYSSHFNRKIMISALSPSFQHHPLSLPQQKSYSSSTTESQSTIEVSLSSTDIHHQDHSTLQPCENKTIQLNTTLKEQLIAQWGLKYTQKRKNLIRWLQSYGQCCRLKRQTVALSQFYCDLYYKSVAYVSKEAKITLAVFLVLASKISDSKILLSSQVSQIFEFNQEEFEKKQVEVSCTLEFQLQNFTYVNSIDGAIRQLDEMFGYDLLEQNYEKYERLSRLYFLAEALYIQFTCVSIQGIFKCFETVFQDLKQTNNSIYYFLHAISQQFQYDETENSSICQCIEKNEIIWQNRKANVRGCFDWRAQNYKNCNYYEFALKYVSFEGN